MSARAAVPAGYGSTAEAELLASAIEHGVAELVVAARRRRRRAA